MQAALDPAHRPDLLLAGLFFLAVKFVQIEIARVVNQGSDIQRDIRATTAQTN